MTSSTPAVERRLGRESVKLSPAIPAPLTALELGTKEAVKQAAAAGAEVKAGMLTVLKVKGGNCRRPLTLDYPKDRHPSPAQRAFRSFLIDRRPAAA